MKYFDNKTCSLKCRSAKHAFELISLITKTNDTQTLLSAFVQCYSCHKLQDEFGRCLLYMAASCGRSEAIEWLIKIKKADIQIKNTESGWTPAHAAAFYGQIDSLLMLIKLGANLNKLDNDTLNVLEHLSLDKYVSSSYKPDFHDDFELYSWGSNTNYNLGNGHDMKKNNAEIVEFFKKLDTSVVQIVMSKFHTAFLTRNGFVYTCGFGIDGRLGHGDEEILMTPKIIESLKNFKCIQIAASRNNTYFLTSDGMVFSCGTNEFKQLGHLGGSNKALSPKQVNLGKRLKGKTVKQIECSRFHVVLLTSTGEVFTFGLNAGQLGHPNERVENATSYNNTICYITEPRLITQLNEPDLKIEIIACSDGVTLALQQSKNILYIFNDYKCKRLFYIKETNSQIKKLRVYGGKLDNQSNPELKFIEDMGDPLVIVALTDSNLLYIWRENDPVWRKIIWSPNKKLLVADFDLNVQGLIFCTLQGLCYKAHFQKFKSGPLKLNANEKNSNTNIQVEILELNQIPFVNRCFQVVCDRKARNYFCLQYHPNTGMRYYPIKEESIFNDDMHLYLSENINQPSHSSSSYSNIELQSHDIELKYRNQTFCCNKFILLSRAPKFFLKLEMKTPNKLVLIDLDNHLAQKFTVQSLDILLKYVYTAKLKSDHIRNSLKTAKINSENSFIKFLADFKELAVDKFGFTELKSVFDQNVYTRNLKELNINLKSIEERYEIMADFIIKLANSIQNKTLRFKRLSYQELWDFQIECNNNQFIKCHKCILIARSEYFKNMMMGFWMESNKCSIQLPFDIDLTQIIVDYFYTDDIQMDFIHSNQNSNSIKSKTEREIEILFNLYILSDQLLVERLKNLCEFKLTNLVNLKNIVEIFEFANQYEAKQLKDFCMEFISGNLVTIIEAKQLESTSSELLQELSEFYRNYYPLVGSRRITPYPSDIGLEPKCIDLIPFELLYDPKFVDGNLDEEIIIKNKASQIQNKNETNDETDKINDNQLKNEATELQKPEKVEISIPEVTVIEKWEKVKKKGRKITNKPSTNLSVDIIKQHSNSSSPQPPASPPELSFTKPISPLQTPSKSEFISIWPSLNENLEIKKHTIESQQLQKKFKKINQKSPQQLQPQQSVVISKPKEPLIANSPTLVWRNLSNETKTPPQHSLLDLMNEEMTKLAITKPKSPVVSKLKTIDKGVSSVKGWNQTASQNQTTHSISQIIELEKRTKDQYVELKSRPLNLIQVEEAAIEDLKKLYNVNNLTDMNIKVEIIDVEIECAPVWKLKN